MKECRCSAVDGAVVHNGRILLIKRRKEPFKGQWALPGGFIERNESPEEAVKREVAEETGIEVEVVKMLGILGHPDRDPRGVLSIVYLCKPLSTNISPNKEEVEGVKWFDISNPPKMAFDHALVIEWLKKVRG